MRSLTVYCIGQHRVYNLNILTDKILYNIFWVSSFFMEKDQAVHLYQFPPVLTLFRSLALHMVLVNLEYFSSCKNKKPPKGSIVFNFKYLTLP